MQVVLFYVFILYPIINYTQLIINEIDFPDWDNPSFKALGCSSSISGTHHIGHLGVNTFRVRILNHLTLS